MVKMSDHSTWPLLTRGSEMAAPLKVLVPVTACTVPGPVGTASWMPSRLTSLLPLLVMRTVTKVLLG
jgi:hypothetical protein